MRTIDCDQGTALWKRARHGKVTASRISDVLDRTQKGIEGARRRNYRIELIAERLSGLMEDHYVSPEMEWGTAQEPFARAAYEIDRGVMVDQVGFVLHPVFEFAGASPDGLVGADGGLEIKCPKVSTHIRWMLEGKVPAEHEPQCSFGMSCTGRKWWDFHSYQPLLPDGLRSFVVRLPRDEERIAFIDQEVKQFNDEVDAVVEDLRKKIIVPAAKDPFEALMEMIDQEIVP